MTVGNRHSCTHECTSGPLANKATGATATCSTTGKNASKWSYKKKALINCLACTSDPIAKFPIGGGGQWICNQSQLSSLTRKCTISCPGDRTPTGTLTCSRKTSLINTTDAWTTKSKKIGWTCSSNPAPLICNTDDISGAMNKYLAKKYPTSQYMYVADDFKFYPETTKCLVSANMLCPKDANKVARMISMCCKKNKAGTKSVWKFKGDPAQDPNNVKCK